MKGFGGLRANVWKYYALNAVKRPLFTPILLLFLIGRGLDTFQVGILLSLGTIAGMVFEIPSGVLSDRLGHKAAIVLSFFLRSVSMILYIFGTSFAWFIAAASFYAVGKAFFSGVGRAFLYETLKILQTEESYEKYQGRSMAISQPLYAGLLVVAPFLYLVHPVLPFALSFFIVAGTCALAFTLVSPTVVASIPIRQGIRELVTDTKRVWRYVRDHKKFTAFTCFFSIAEGVRDAADEFKQVYLLFIGLPRQLFGFVYATERVLQGVGGGISHYLSKFFSPLRTVSAFYGLAVVFLLCGAFLRHIAGIVIFPLRNFTEGMLLPIRERCINREISGGDRAALLSVGNLLQGLAEAACLPLIGWLLVHFSVPNAFLAAAVGTSVLLGGLAAWARKIQRAAY